jgi:hypothetical protein
MAWARLRVAGNNPVICGRKLCSGCGCWRHLMDFPSRRRDPLEILSRCYPCARVAARERLAQDPAQLELRREYQRIWGEAHRRAQGIPERQWVHGRKVEPVNARWTMDASTLRGQVRAWLIENDASEEHLAESAGVSDRLIRRLLHENAQVSVWAADRLAMTMGLHLELVA